MTGPGDDRDGWTDSPDLLELRPDEVHVWMADLRALRHATVSLADCLAPEEMVRAKRFVFAEDGSDFIVARAYLRAILSWYLKTQPDQLSFGYGPHGKPELVDGLGVLSAVSFNLSHSHGLALYALSLRRAVGIDIERIDPSLEFDSLSRQFFSPSENRVLCGLFPGLKPSAFFKGWTSKEAIVKAIGDGLSLPLDRFDVCLLPEADARLIAVDGDVGKAAEWQLYALSPPSGYAAAVAVEGRDRVRLRYWRCPDDAQQLLGRGRSRSCEVSTP